MHVGTKCWMMWSNIDAKAAAAYTEEHAESVAKQHKYKGPYTASYWQTAAVEQDATLQIS